MIYFIDRGVTGMLGLSSGCDDEVWKVQTVTKALFWPLGDLVLTENLSFMEMHTGESKHYQLLSSDVIRKEMDSWWRALTWSVELYDSVVVNEVASSSGINQGWENRNSSWVLYLNFQCEWWDKNWAKLTMENTWGGGGSLSQWERSRPLYTSWTLCNEAIECAAVDVAPQSKTLLIQDES